MHAFASHVGLPPPAAESTVDRAVGRQPRAVPAGLCIGPGQGFPETFRWRRYGVIRGLHHVAGRTTDIERSAKFYSDVLGFEEIMRLHFEDGSYLVQLKQEGSIIELFGGGRTAGTG